MSATGTRLRGVGAAAGVAVAAPWVYRPPTGGGAERVPLDEAIQRARSELDQLADRLRQRGREEEAGILEAQAMMAQDPELLNAAERHRSDGRSAAEAILAAGDEQAATLAELDDELLAARAADVRDVVARIARIVRGEAPPRLTERSIAVAIDLPPSVTAELDPSLLAGIVLEAGSPTAHAAILARALGIPAVVSVPKLLDAADSAGTLAIDGTTGEVAVDPDAAERERFERATAAWREQERADRELASEPLVTSDGHRVTLLANIGQPEEAARAAESGAEGIGLFRTEFMFMGRSSAPSVAAQAGAYAEALAAFPNRPVVIRLLDIGGDKPLPYLEQRDEANPFLGIRAIRLAQENRTLLVGQVRAILDAARGSPADVWVMAPMVADLDDVALVRGLVEEAGGADVAVRLGIMVELPAAAVLADQLADAVDFFSIGTNDLTQYLLAADRTNPALAERQDAMHPASLRAVRDVIGAGHAAGIPVAVCGELAGDPVGALALVGLGIDELSMDAGSFGRVKRALGSVTRADAEALAVAACEATSAAEARDLVTKGLSAMAGSTHG